MNPFRHLVQCLLLCLALSLCAANSLATQLTGTVKSPEGNPLRGITVYSYDDRGVEAPKAGRRFYATTNARGQFKLRNHGRTIYFQHDAYQPFVKVVDYSTRTAQVMLERAKEAWVVPTCDASKDFQANKASFVELDFPKFFLPGAADARFKRVKDIDYVLYTFAYGPTEKPSVLQGWFGLNAIDLSASTRSFLQSQNFSARWVDFGDCKAMDIQGETTDGKRWRYISFSTDAIFYEDATQEAAKVFDNMLGRICYQPTNEPKAER